MDNLLTPSKYWRIPFDPAFEFAEPQSTFTLPQELANQSSPPARGHGIAMAAYAEVEQTGMFRWIGVISGGAGLVRTVEWRPVRAEIWVDTGYGRMKWREGSFEFAPNKNAGYGLHELWHENFDSMEFRDKASMATRPVGRVRGHAHGVARERLDPIEVIGEPSIGPNAGVVYVLKSLYGYKVGRTRNVPVRMRAFGVHLPFLYTIPLCVWFEDCHVAERRFHEIFSDKRINGEWFDLDEDDIDRIRLKE